MKTTNQVIEEPTIRSIDNKLDTFMESQGKVNLMFADAHKDIAKTLARAEAQQVEITNTATALIRLTDKVERESEKVAGIHAKVSVNSSLVDKTEDLKKYFIKGMIGVFIMFLASIGTQLYKAGRVADESSNLNLKVVAAIQEMLSEKQQNEKQLVSNQK